jgi:hypothetical protein
VKVNRRKTFQTRISGANLLLQTELSFLHVRTLYMNWSFVCVSSQVLICLTSINNYSSNLIQFFITYVPSPQLIASSNIKTLIV